MFVLNLENRTNPEEKRLKEILFSKFVQIFDGDRLKVVVKIEQSSRVDIRIGGYDENQWRNIVRYDLSCRPISDDGF